MESKLIECIQFSLDHYLWQNAVFLAEKLYAQSNTEPNLHILATCYYRSGKTNRAHFVLKDCSSTHNKYLYAVCCFELGKLKEAETALTYAHDDPHDPAALYLLGLIYRIGNQRERASECLRKSLQLYPFLWSAFEVLCSLGEDTDPALIFNSNTFDTPSSSQTVHNNPSLNTPITPATPLTAHSQPSPIPILLSSPIQDQTPPPSLITHTPGSHLTPSPGWGLAMKTGGADPSPYSVISPSFATPTTPIRKPAAPANKRKPEEAKRKPRANLFAVDPPVPRRSARLSFSSVDNISNPGSVTSNISNNINTADDRAAHKRDKDKRRVVRRHHAPSAPLTANVNINAHLGEEHDSRGHTQHPYNRLQPQQHGTTEVLTLLCALGTAFRHVSMYRCKDALTALSQLPLAQARTGWALVLTGRAHFELVDYRAAAKAFDEARRLEPHRGEGMEIYSTVLWHLRRETDLSHLAHSLVEFDHLDPRSWCAVGNCFSLQKDHDTALKMFRRALQLDSSFTYAYTLSGHEYVANDDLDKALASFRSAIRVDPRHYNAWYGLGMIYYRQEKYKLAEYHFRKALSINGSSSVLYCYVGMVLSANKQYKEALHMLESAIALDNKNTLARYQKACALAGLQDTQAALIELESLRDAAPREASIHTLMARLYRQLRQPYKALAALAAAADLDPKNASNLKAAIDKLTNPNAADELDDDGIL